MSDQPCQVLQPPPTVKSLSICFVALHLWVYKRLTVIFTASQAENRVCPFPCSKFPNQGIERPEDEGSLSENMKMLECIKMQDHTGLSDHPSHGSLRHVGHTESRRNAKSRIKMLKCIKMLDRTGVLDHTRILGHTRVLVRTGVLKMHRCWIA